MKFKALFLIGLIVPCLMVACRVRQVAPNGVTQTKTVTTVMRDTIVKLEADSSFYKAWIDCVNGKPVIVKMPLISPKNDTTIYYNRPGKYIDIPKVILNGNELSVNCEAKAQELFRAWQQQYIKENEKEVITLPPVEVEKQLSWWQTLQIYCGRLLLSGIAVYLIYRLIKSKLNPL